MRRTPWLRLLGIALGSTAASYAVLLFAESRGASVVAPPVLSGLLLLVIAAVVVVLGWNVRQYTRGDRPDVDAIVAARTVVLATASAYTGSLLAGWYAAHVLVVLPDLAIESRRGVAVGAGAVLVCALVLGVVGLVVERWCEVRREDDDDDPRGTGTAPSGSPV